VTVCTILYIEDDADDILLFERAFSRDAVPCDLHCVDSIEQARCYLLGQPPFSHRERFRFPDLIVTDLAVQGESGVAFIQWLRNQPDFANIAVACLTGSDDPRKLGELADLGVSTIRKTSLFKDALGVIRNLILR